MWSDTLLAAERAHLIRLVVWAVTNAALGTGLVAIISLRRWSAPIVLWFGIQSLAWGTVELIVSATRWYALSMRDVSGATRLDRLTWLTIGLDVGIIAFGAAIAFMGWTQSRRFGAFGVGLGVVVQGLGLLVLDLVFVSILGRLV